MKKNRPPVDVLQIPIPYTVGDREFNKRTYYIVLALSIYLGGGGAFMILHSMFGLF